MKAVIVCNGSINDYACMEKYFEAAGLIICADGGAAHLRRFEIDPTILLGDFDSISDSDYKYFQEHGVEIVKFPAEKDMTDTEIAVELAMERGCDSIVIIGGVGTRLDHSLSNIFLLKRMLDKDVKGIVANEFNEITLISDRIRIKREVGIKVSLLPVSEKVCGVTTKGLYYPLKDADIEIGSTWGVSNEFVDDMAEVTINKGLLLVIKARD